MTSGFSCWTEKEIRHQPQMLLKTYDLIEKDRDEVDEFIKSIISLDNVQVILTGAGTSAFIGDTAAPILRRRLSVPVSSIPTTDIVCDPVGHIPRDCPLLLVSFARSGSSPESLAAVEIATELNSNCFHLIVTCNSEGQLYQQSKERENTLILPIPQETCDRGFAMTSSMTSMLLGCLVAFRCKGMNSDDVIALSESISLLLESQSDAYISPLQCEEINRIVWLGSGCLQGIAHESSLKMLELTAGQIPTFYESPVGFRHGPKSIIDERTQVIIFLSSDSYTRRYDLDLVNELINDAVAKDIKVICNTPSILDEDEHLIILPNAEEFIDSQLAIAYLVYAQNYALAKSFHYSLTPDNPSPSGQVNRVVKGVKIHSLSKIF